MKKFVLLLTLFIVLSNCEISPQKAHAYEQVKWLYLTEVRNGMTFGIWWTDGDGSNREDAVAVVNLTKDALEIELIKLQIAKLKNENR
jgi:hypothetical protein